MERVIGYTDNLNELNWEQIKSSYSWVQDMTSVPQDPIFHAEGNVETHTRMVVENLLALEEYKKLSDQDKYIMFVGALMHDIEKRSTTAEEDGRIVSPRHAKRGEYTTRGILYRDIPTPFFTREKIAKIVRHHGLPLWVFDKPNPQKEIINASIISDVSLLSMIAKADVLGRICPDAKELLYRIEMFRELGKENNCINQTKEFPSDLSRFEFFNKNSTYPDYEPFDDRKFNVKLMCGIPGSGKDYFINHTFSSLPVISLDFLRANWKKFKPDDKKTIKPGDESGTGKIVQEAKEQAREYMRKKQDFVWNGTNLTRQIRQPLIDLFESYGGRVEIIYVEVPYKKVLHQNEDRDVPIPEKILEKFIDKLEMPSPTEAHSVQYIVSH